MLNKGREELAKARRQGRTIFTAVFVFSIFVNLLMLTGPLYMMQVYDRVLASRSVETLAALTILVGFLFLMMGLLDYSRGRLMARVGARFQNTLDRRVFSAIMTKATYDNSGKVLPTGLRDLEAIQRLFSSPILLALCDIPWTPVFLMVIFIFHPWLGILATVGGLILIVITFLNQKLTSAPLQVANSTSMMAEHWSEQIRAEAETVQSLGMRNAGFDRWQKARGTALDKTISASDFAGVFSSTTKTLRLFLQSAILGLGAYLAIHGEISAGAMIAASILMGRALSPIDQAIGQWAMVDRAKKGWQDLAVLLGEIPTEPDRTNLPRPAAKLVAQQVTVIPPGHSQASLKAVSFAIEPGQALGVIGPSGSGKSTLARTITGVWRPAGGKMRLDGATLDQYDPDVLGGYIGYLPQRVTLFDGTIADNISRLSVTPDQEQIVNAAKRAAAHDMIVKLPNGYDTRVSAAGGMLSGGQMQRIGLARALYGDPVLLVLDEPNSNLDNEGSAALNGAIKQMKAAGQSVIIMAHRPSAIEECDLLLVLDLGMTRAYGPRDEVLQKTVKNHASIGQNKQPGGIK
ncbi:ABC protein toxin exporter, fused ATPase and inner membrane domain [Rhodobacterales bacterium HTCC2150]|nr:ABC protein toxin exporter, fused ATPase and inner membrane domain [Rhodobacterales bacterium HTCC2150] [Rhodobacteraceae bacterium HTCC2150]